MAQATKHRKKIAISMAFIAITGIFLLVFFLPKKQFEHGKNNFSAQIAGLEKQIKLLKSENDKQVAQLEQQIGQITNQLENSPKNSNLSANDLADLAKLSLATKQQTNIMAQLSILASLHTIEQQGDIGKSFHDELAFLTSYVNRAFGADNRFSSYLQELANYNPDNLPSQQDLEKLFKVNLAKNTKQANHLEAKLINWFKTQIKIEHLSSVEGQHNIYLSQEQKLLANQDYSQLLQLLNSTEQRNQPNWQNFMQKLEQKLKFQNLLQKFRQDLSTIDGK